MSALKKITTRAKQIFRKGGTWKAAIKKASAEYRSGKKISGTLSGNTSRTVTGVKKKRKAIVRRVKKLHHAEGREIAKLGSVSHHLANAKKILEHKIGVEEMRKFKAAKKSAKNKIAKKISVLKSQYRKVCH
jgi:hypothetical protein